MNEIILGRTGIMVTELCFGALPMGPAQKNMPVMKSAEIVTKALRCGIHFIDTAQIYRTYEPIRLAMETTGIRPVIATKSPASTYVDMDTAVNEALNSLGVEYIDIFLLHAARVGTDVFEAREGALKCLLDYKSKGIIRAIGISTHSVEIVEKASEHSDMDIIFPILNKAGMGILDGTLIDMERAIEQCFTNGKGVYIMKALAGGNLIGDYANSMEYVRQFASGRAAIAVGMVSTDEVDMNVRYFNGETINIESDKLVKKFFVVPSLCKSCGSCVETCHSDALTIPDSCAIIDDSKCLRCGYCVTSCPQFAIRMI